MIFTPENVRDIPPAVRREANKWWESGGNYWPDPFEVNARMKTLWHRQDIDDVSDGESIEFFNVNKSDHASNWNQGGLASGQLFIGLGLRIGLFGGVDAAGNAEADSLGYDANGVKALQAGGDKALLIENGVVNLGIDDRRLVDEEHGLYNFPQGGGIVQSYFAATTASTVTYSAESSSNGQAHNGNAWFLTPPLVLVPNQGFYANVKYNFDHTLADTLVMKMGVVGMYFTAGSR